VFVEGAYLLVAGVGRLLVTNIREMLHQEIGESRPGMRLHAEPLSAPAGELPAAAEAQTTGESVEPDRPTQRPGDYG
jgi:hypothetical protein